MAARGAGTPKAHTRRRRSRSVMSHGALGIFCASTGVGTTIARSAGLWHGRRGSCASAPKHARRVRQRAARQLGVVRDPRVDVRGARQRDADHGRGAGGRRGERPARRASARTGAARTGSSTSTFVSHAATTVSPRIATAVVSPTRVAERVRGEDQQRPVPEIDPVGDVAQELHRRRASSARGAHRERGRPARITASAPSTGSSAARRGTPCASLKPSAATAMATSPSHDQAGARAAGARSSRRHQRQQPAGAELPRARRRGEVGGRRVGGRQVDRVGEAQHGERRQREHDAPGGRGARRAARRARPPGSAAARRGRTAPRPTATRSAEPATGRRWPRSSRPPTRRGASSARRRCWPACRRRTAPSAVTRDEGERGGRARTAARAARPAGCAALGGPRTPGSDSVERRSTSRSRSAVIRNPEIAKKTSTPTNPPGTASGQKWKSTTASTAIARSAWISSRILRWGVDSAAVGAGRDTASVDTPAGLPRYPLDSPSCACDPCSPPSC